MIPPRFSLPLIFCYSPRAAVSPPHFPTFRPIFNCAGKKKKTKATPPPASHYKLRNLLRAEACNFWHVRNLINHVPHSPLSPLEMMTISPLCVRQRRTKCNIDETTAERGGKRQNKSDLTRGSFVKQGNRERQQGGGNKKRFSFFPRWQEGRERDREKVIRFFYSAAGFSLFLFRKRDEESFLNLASSSSFSVAWGKSYSPFSFLLPPPPHMKRQITNLFFPLRPDFPTFPLLLLPGSLFSLAHHGLLLPLFLRFKDCGYEIR